MKKGKFGLSLTAIAVIAFAFVVLRQPIAVLLVCGFALLAEKDEWLNRQTIQALLLMIVYYLADLVIGWIFGGLATFFGWVKLFRVASVMGTIGSIVGTLLYLALAVFSVIAILNLLRGKDAGLPLISKIAGGDFVIKAKPKPAPAPAPSPIQAQYAIPPQPAPPVQEQYVAPPQPAPPVQEQYVAPPQPAPPVQEQYVAPPQPAVPLPSVKLCSNCSTPLHEDALFCAECGTKVE